MSAIRNPFFLDSGSALNTVQSQEDPDFLAPKGQAAIPEGPRPSALRGVAPEPVQVASAPMWVMGGQQTASDAPKTPMWVMSPPATQEAPVAPPEASGGNLLTDTGNLLKMGVNSTTQNFRELVRNVPVVGESIVRGVDSIDKAITGRQSEDILKGNVEEARQNLTPETRAAEEKKWWDSDKNTFGDAWTDPRAYLSGVVQSAPEQLVTMIPAMRMAKFAYAGKVAAGASAEIASAAAARAATIAGGILEGSMAGAASSREVRDKILGMGQDQLKDSEALRSLMASGMDFDEARRQIANDSASQAFITSGVVTGMFGGFGDRALAKIVTGKAAPGLLKRIGKGLVGEGVLEEFPQEFGSAVAENVALQKATPSLGTFDDALNRGLGGLATGGVQGGAMAAAARGQSATPAPARPDTNPVDPGDLPGGPSTSPGGQVRTEGAGTGEQFFLPKNNLLREMNERPEFIAALYDSAEPEDRPNILKAIDRLDKRELFNQIISDSDLMQRGRGLVMQDEENADFFRRSLLNLADTRPTGGNVKMPPRNVTQRDAEAIDDDLLNDDAYWQSLGAAPTGKAGGFSALENTIAQTIQSANDMDYLGRVGQRIAQRITDIQPDSLLKLRELYAQRKTALEAPKPPQNAGTPPGDTSGTPTDSAAALELLAAPGANVDYGQFRFSKPEIRNGFESLGVDPSKVNPSGKGGTYTADDLKRVSIALDVLTKAQQNAKGVPNIRLSKTKPNTPSISLRRGDAGSDFKRSFESLSKQVYQLLRDAQDNGVDYDPGNKISQALDGAAYALDETGNLKFAADLILDAAAELRAKDESLALRLYNFGERMRADTGGKTPSQPTSSQVKLTGTSPYLSKDQRKADIATKFIGRGSPSSSTAAYAKNFGSLANTGIYSPQDVVFVSAEGNRGGRIEPDFAEIKRALDAGATIVTDDAANRNRPYNIGERQVAEFLTSNGYRESAPGRWSAVADTRAIGKRIDNVPMYYQMPREAVRPEMRWQYEDGTSTLQLIEDGARTATTRRPFANVGDIITFKGDGTEYRVTAVEKPDLASEEGRSKWEQREGWSLGYIDSNPKLRAQVYSPNVVQTVFEPVNPRPARKVNVPQSESEAGPNQPAIPLAPKTAAPSDAKSFVGEFNNLSSKVYSLLRAAEDNGVDYDPGNKIHQLLDGAAYALDETGDLKFAADLILDADAALRPKNESLALRLYDLGERMRVAAGGKTPSGLNQFEVGSGQSNLPEKGQDVLAPTPVSRRPSPIKSAVSGDSVAPLVQPNRSQSVEVGDVTRPVAKSSAKPGPTISERMNAMVGSLVPKKLADRVNALVEQGNTQEAEALTQSIERIYKGSMMKEMGDDLVTLSNLLANDKVAEAEALVDKAYAKRTAPDKAKLNRISPDVQNSLRSRLDALASRLKLANVVVDPDRGMTVEDAMQEIDLLRLTPTEQNAETANELLDLVAKARQKQVLSAATSKKVSVEERLKLKNLADKIFKDAGMVRTRPVASSTQSSESIEKVSAPSKPREVSKSFYENYNGSDSANKDFKRLVDLLVGQYLRTEPISKDPEEMTGVAKDFFDRIGEDAKSPDYEKKLVKQMLKTMSRENFLELVKATGKERKKVVVTKEQKRLNKFKADVGRLTRMLDASTMFVDRETGEILAFEEAPMRKALEAAHARLDAIYAQINRPGTTFEDGGKKRSARSIERVNEDKGGVVSQMEFPSGDGDRAGERRLVEITSNEERRIQALLNEAKDIKDSIVMLQQGMNRELARRFRERATEIQNELLRLSEQAINDGAPASEVAKIRDELTTGISAFRAENKGNSRPKPRAKEETIEIDQPPIVGIAAAKKLVEDFNAKKIQFVDAVSAARQQIKDKEYTLDDLISEFRKAGKDFSPNFVSSLMPVAARERMADYVRRHGGGYVHRHAWLTSLDKALRAERKGNWNTKLFESLTDAEKALYGEWKEKRTDLALRRDDRGDMSASSGDVEDAFPDLLFVRFPLDGMRNFKNIKRDSDRLNIVSIFSDPETAYDAWMGDIDYALKKRPDMAQNIKAYLPEDEANAYRAWKRQQIDSAKLRARMIDQSKFYTTAHELVPLPDSAVYNEMYKDEAERKAAVARAKAWWEQYENANENERLALLANQAAIRDGVRVSENLSDEGMEILLEDLLERIKANDDSTSRIESFDRTAERGAGGADYSVQNLRDESTDELLNEGETDIDSMFGEQDDDDEIESEPRFARGRYSGVVSAANVQIQVERLKAKWAAAPEIVVLENASQLDEPLRSAVLEKAGEGSDAKGLFITEEGTVYLFSDHMTSESDVQWTLFHEVYGHFGMRMFLGDTFDAFLQNVYNTRADIRAAADAKSQSDGIGRLEAVEEVLADSAGDAKTVGLFKQMVGRFVQWMRKNGFESVANYIASHTDAEVAYILKSARDAVRNGAPAAYRGTPAELRLAQQQRTPYELFALNNGNTVAYARYDPTRDIWYVFNSVGGNPNNYNVATMQKYDDVRAFMRRFGKVEGRMRSGLYIDDKLLPDLIHNIPDYRDEPSRVKRALNWVQLQAQNEYLPVWKVVDFLSKNGTVTDQLDLRKDLSGLYERKTAVMLEKFRHKFVDKINDAVADAKALGVTDEFINLYAVARHAEERNRQVAKINPSLQYGSGMSPRTPDGKGYLDVLEQARSRGWDVALEKIGALTDRMSREKIAYEVATGMLSGKEAQKRLAAYKKYVNLSGVNGDMDKFDDPMSQVSGRRFNVKGKDKRAMGRSDVAPDVLARTITAFEASIIRGQKNIVAQRLLALMEMNHDPNFVSINKVATKRSIVDGMVQEVDDENYIGRKDVMVAKVKGVPVTMEFKQTGKNSFAEAIHGVVYPPDSNAALYAIGQIQNRIGRLLTTWNPVWVGVNYLRDVQTLMFNAAVDKRIGTAQAAKMVKRTLPAGRVAMYIALRDYHPTTPQGKAMKATFAKMVGQPDARMIAWYKEARDQGALTSFLDRKGLEEQIKAINTAMHGETLWDRAKGVLEFMELMTIPMEMGPRLAAYATMREAGWTQRDAATLAGEITVNFNMRGKAAWLRQLYLFFNPAVQGTAKIVSLAKNDPQRFIAASFAFAGLGALVGIIGRMFSDDDEDGINKLDKIPEFKRATSMVLKADMPGAAIPIPYGWNSFYALGTFLTDYVHGVQPLTTTAGRIFKAAWESSLPLGSSGLESKQGPVTTAVKALSPTLALPMVEYMVNENRYGAPIYKKGFPGQAPAPDAYSAFRSVSPISRTLAEGVNSLTGGNRTKEGAVSFNPAFMDHMINGLLPGIPAEIYKAASMGIRYARGEELRNVPTPVLDRFTAKVSDSWDSSAYMRVKELVDAKWREYENAPSESVRNEIRTDFKGLAEAKQIVSSVDQTIRKVEANYNKMLVAMDRGHVPEARMVEIRNEYDRQKRDLYHRAIKAAISIKEGDDRPIREALLGG